MKRVLRTFLVLACIGLLSSGMVLAESASRGFGFGGAMAMAFFPDMTGINTFMSENGLPPMCDAMIGAGGGGRGGVIGGLTFGGMGWGVVAESWTEERSAELVFGGGGFDIGAAIGGDERSVLTIGTVLGAGANVLSITGYLVETVDPQGLVPEPTYREVGRAIGFVQPYLSMSAQIFPWMGFEFRAGYVFPVWGIDFGDLLGIPAPSLELSGPTVSFGLSFGGIASGRDRNGDDAKAHQDDKTTVVSDGTFAVAPEGEIVIENGIGEVLISSYEADSSQTTSGLLVEWQAARTAKESRIDELQVAVEGSEQRVTLRTLGEGQVDYIVGIPAGVDLKVRNGIGMVTLIDHQAQTIILENAVGEIETKGVQATALVMAGELGKITISDVDATSLIAEMGIGEIDLELAADTSASLVAKAGLGDVSIDHFPGMVGGTRGFLGRTADVTLGAGERTVDLKVWLGEITIEVQ